MPAMKLQVWMCCVWICGMVPKAANHYQRKRSLLTGRHSQTGPASRRLYIIVAEFRAPAPRRPGVKLTYWILSRSFSLGDNRARACDGRQKRPRKGPRNNKKLKDSIVNGSSTRNPFRTATTSPRTVERPRPTPTKTTPYAAPCDCL